MRQNLDAQTRREVKRRLHRLLAYYLPEFGPEHSFCRMLRQELELLSPEERRAA